MATDGLSLLFKLRASNEASPAIKAAQADIAKLTSSTSAQFGQMQKVTTQSLGAVTQSLTQVAGQLPVVGGAVSSLSSSLGSLTSTATTSAGSVGLIAGAAVLATTAIGGTLKALFDITVQAAEFQGKLFDTSQQLGISVETLSTLEIVAKTTGGSIEGITASLGIFQKKLEDALDPTSKESALLQKLGIDTNNTEEALRQALTVLSRMPEGFRQTATALELFGRGGKAILAILKEMGGDLDGATEKFRAMGILISTDAAKAADKFNDQLALLGFQIRSVTAIIGNEAMPTILSALTRISKAFEDNQTTITAWANSTADAARGALILADAVRSIGTQITGLSNLPVPGIIRLLGSISGATGILTGLQKLGTPEIGALNVPDLATPLRESTATPGSVIDLGKAGKAAKEAQQRANREIALALQELEEVTRVNRIALERERDLDLKTIEEWKEESITAAHERLAGLQGLFEQERENARQFIKNRQDLSLALREIDQKDEKAQTDFTLRLQEINDQARKRREQAELETENRIADLRDVFRQLELDKVKDFVNRGVIAESEGIARVLVLLQDEHAQRQKLRDIELEQETTSAKRKADLGDEKIAAEQRYTDEFLRLSDERNRAREKEDFEAGRRPGGGPEGKGIGDDALARIAGAAADATAGIPPLIQQLSILDALMKSIRLNMLSFSDSISGSVVGAFHDLAGAVGIGIAAWALYSESLGKALQKALAQTLAHISAEATIQALLHTAYAIGRAAFGDFGGAAKHGLAALKFAAVAAAAGLGARTVAGGAFATGGGSAGGADSGREPSGQLNPLTLPRNQPQQNVVHHVIQIRVDDSKFGQAVTGHLMDEYRTTGPLRDMILNDGQG